jgi:hypothetical protein
MSSRTAPDAALTDDFDFSSAEDTLTPLGLLAAQDSKH